MKQIVITIISAILILHFYSNGLAQQPKPNIIYFLVDDMGWQDTSVPFWDHKTKLNDRYHTPNMERLASQGMKFTQAYANPLCSPTRVSLLTGMNATRHKVTNWTLLKDKSPDKEHPVLEIPEWNVNGLSPVPDSQAGNTYYAKTLPMILKEAGYFSIHIGKGHFAAKGTLGEDPINLGFDVNVAGHAAGAPQSYYAKDNFGNDDPEHGKVWGVPGLEQYHGTDLNLTDVLTKEAVSAMENATIAQKPFFLYMSHYAIHGPWMKDERYYHNYEHAGLKKFDAVYASMIEGMDKSLGDIMDKLKELNIEDNTIIVFMSDNGAPQEATLNYPLRGHKLDPYEGGIRVPMIVKWPGVVKPNTSSSIPVIIEDVFPSFIEMAGIVNFNKTGSKIDGKTFVPLLKGKEDDAANKRQFVWHFPHYFSNEPYSVIREGDWKLIYHYKESVMELYNIKEDIHEENDLSLTYTAKKSELGVKLSNYLRKVGASLPLVKKTGQPCKLPDEI
ncbi:MAG: sulfatase [Cyclobacteriaceae bacterium]